MFRVRLAAVIVISLCFVLFLGAALYWGANQVALYFHRSQEAYEAFDRYERLSQQAYRHFKQRLDWLLTDNEAAQAGVESSKHRLYDAMKELRNTAMKEKGERAEPERVARFTAFLEASEYRFNEVESLRREGEREEAVRALSKFSKEEIDQKFQPLIDTAIDAEREQAGLAREKLSAWVEQSQKVAILAASMAVSFSLLAGIWLIRGVKKPIEALMRGTDEIATGNLEYRIDLESRDEFAYLASHFNQMAQELEFQQHRLKEAHAVLEEKVAERTLELHQLNRELQRMDLARREFFADISHELRTPITVIRGEAEVTLRGTEGDTEAYKEALQRIVELSMQLGKLVNDLLFLARAETANMQFEWEKLDLAELVSNAVEDIQVLAQEKSISVALEAPSIPLWVQGDKQRLRQVLYILGDNACRYSDPGGHLQITLRAEGKEAIFSFSDQGIGIPSQDLEIIFDRYFRSNNARHTRDDGTGLGLPMAKSIVKTHGGRIAVTSAEGSGSTFTVTLPLAAMEAQPERPNMPTTPVIPLHERNLS
ncbi:MAG: ATP-binding protein [Methylococcaceae bacterium]|nr:ATP-binding protein [Methylococcaceae bacterium]